MPGRDAKKNPTLAKIMRKFIGTTNVYKVKHRCNTTLQADVTQEGRPADNVIEMANGVLDTDKIALWWRGYAYETASYHTIKKNCSTTVIRALRAGGATLLAAPHVAKAQTQYRPEYKMSVVGNRPIPFAEGAFQWAELITERSGGRINHDAHLFGALAGMAFVAVGDPEALHRALQHFML